MLRFLLCIIECIPISCYDCITFPKRQLQKKQIQEEISDMLSSKFIQSAHFDILQATEYSLGERVALCKKCKHLCFFSRWSLSASFFIGCIIRKYEKLLAYFVNLCLTGRRRELKKQPEKKKMSKTSTGQDWILLPGQIVVKKCAKR